MPRWRDVVDYALERPADDLSTSALAERVNISPRQLSRLFREHLNETPAAAVRRIRLELAVRLLVATERPVSDVARRCGFATAETFRQAFTAKYGVSPRAYRAEDLAGRSHYSAPRRCLLGKRPTRLATDPRMAVRTAHIRPVIPANSDRLLLWSGQGASLSRGCCLRAWR